MYDVREFANERGSLTTDSGSVTFTIKQFPHNCGITTISGVEFEPKAYTKIYKDKLIEEFNNFLTQSYKGAGDDWHPANYDWNPFAQKLNVAILVVTDAEWGEYNDKNDASLWRMCINSKKWKKGVSTINPNSNNEIAIFTHVRKPENVSENY